MTVRDGEKLGSKGENIACFLLEQALDCCVIPWKPDKGLDAPVQFVSTAPGNALLHFNVQIKTGSSFIEDCGHQWRVKRLDRRYVEQWRHAQTPVVFIWVHPRDENCAYWHLVTQETSPKHFFISKARRISPATRFELTMKLVKWEREERREPFGLLIPPLCAGIRDIAKQQYRRLMSEPQPVNPLLGPVRISWHGWRHMTSQNHRTGDIFRRLQLLPILRWAIENPAIRTGFRRVRTARLGRWVFETRIIPFRVSARVYGRPDANIEYALRETIRYPVDWPGNAGATPFRSVVLESLRERESEESDRGQ